MFKLLGILVYYSFSELMQRISKCVYI